MKRENMLKNQKEMNFYALAFYDRDGVLGDIQKIN